jgi:hypothetical protein
MAGKQGVQFDDAAQPIGDAALGQHRALRVEQADVVVPLGPIHSDEQHSHLPGRSRLLYEPEKDRGALMAVLTWHDIPPAVRAFSPTSRGTLSPKSSLAREVSPVLTRRRLPTSLLKPRPVSPLGGVLPRAPSSAGVPDGAS